MCKKKLKNTRYKDRTKKTKQKKNAKKPLQNSQKFSKLLQDQLSVADFQIITSSMVAECLKI